MEDTKKISQLADDESAALLQSLDDYRSNMRTDPALTDAIEKYIKEGADARKKVQDKALLCTPEANEQAYELYVSEYLPKVELMNEAVLKVADEIKKLEIEQNNSAKQVYNTSFIGILVAFFGAVALSIGMGATLSRNIVRPLKEIETAAKEMAKGSLTVDLTYKAKDELGIPTKHRIKCQAVLNKFPAVHRHCHRGRQNRLHPWRNWRQPSMRFPHRLNTNAQSAQQGKVLLWWQTRYGILPASRRRLPKAQLL